MRVFYFAYGSNMKTSRIAGRVPSVEALGVARLDGFRLAMNKRGRDGSAKANIEESSADSVFGVLFTLEEGHWEMLDVFERGYVRREVQVFHEGTLRTSVTYVCERATQDLVAFDWYLDLMKSGAEEHGLPARYREELGGIPTVPDPKRNP
ncbi:MAG: gamma-glutamylcyclotransferase [Myxococcales bacterium]|nr:gamma-glutamylcyclotransferase [Myxococcales bacterium]